MEERKILIGLIMSNEFIMAIRKILDLTLFESNTARIMAEWCIEYYDQYGKAPFRHIEDIFYDKLKSDNRLQQDLAEEIEQDILPSLNEEYETAETGKFNAPYLIDETRKYLNNQNLKNHTEQIEAFRSQGRIEEAERLAKQYLPIVTESNNVVDMSDPSILEEIDRAFNRTIRPVVEFPGILGEFWNDELVWGGFVALLAPEKRGKTFWLIEIAMRASKQKAKVVFFQAGDMTREEQLLRMSVYLAKKSNKAKYSGTIREPEHDCIYNQLDLCDKEIRESDEGLFDGVDDLEKFRNEIMYEDLIEAENQAYNYKPCWNCSEFKGVPYMREVDVGSPLDTIRAKRNTEEFFIKKNRKFKLATYANGTLSVDEISSCLSQWEREGFVPDLIAIDYADLLIPGMKMDFRHQQNEIWKTLRGISQERHALLVTATQADARAYDKNILGKENYSEDKRKLGHVTAMYGLNQDKNDREKKLGIMRINEIVKREDAFTSNNKVYVLQNLERGRPFIRSYK